jgi:hypothetical protein
VLKGKVPAPAGWLAGVGLRASSAVRELLRERTHLVAREVARFDAAHDALWLRMAEDFTCGVVRDASFLNWKYVDQPGQPFRRLEIRDGGQVKAVAVLSFREADHAYQYRRAFLVDLVAPLSDTAVMQQVLRVIVDTAADNDADAVVCLHINAHLTRSLERAAFFLRKPTRFLMVSCDVLTEELQHIVKQPDGWLVTQGDSDLDRPESAREEMT